MAQPVQLTYQGTVLASAARATAGATGPIMQNAACKGIMLWLDIPTLASTSLQLVLKGIDPVSGDFVTIASGTAQTGTATTHGLLVYPGITTPVTGTTDNQLEVAEGVLPATWQVQVVKVGVGTDTYSVGYSLIP